MILCQISSVASRNGSGLLKPALLIITLTEPKALRQASTAARTDSRLVTSTLWKIAWPPSALILSDDVGAHLLVEIGNHDAKAILGKRRGNLASDAAGRAGDNRAAADWISHHVLLIFCYAFVLPRFQPRPRSP